ncbi:hypothetical protein [Moraxella bovis]|nr:hypothetical protein [Moraxella bovis]UYZ82008.1 hypothetical protein LP113_04620 [Moraxella bovis]UYZ82017.1 hypothetical protein LP113_04665 [Moraxella bovis]
MDNSHCTNFNQTLKSIVCVRGRLGGANDNDTHARRAEYTYFSSVFYSQI